MDDITFPPEIEEPQLPPFTARLSDTVPAESRGDNVPEMELMDPSLLDHQLQRRQLAERLERDPAFKRNYIKQQAAKALDAQARQLVTQVREDTAPPAPTPVARTDVLEDLPEASLDSADGAYNRPPASVYIAHVEHFVLHLHLAGK